VTLQFRDILQAEIPYDPGKHQVRWRISAYVLTLNAQNQILMVLPADNGDKWMLPGGEIEPTEELFIGLARECLEETSCELASIDPEPIHLSQSGFFHAGYYLNSLNLFFPSELISTQTRLKAQDQEEIKEVIWQDLDKINQLDLHWLVEPAIFKFSEITK
jgi:8-oxo-dGTP pyrophosphatase MutT (NUDIX family)